MTPFKLPNDVMTSLWLLKRITDQNSFVNVQNKLKGEISATLNNSSTHYETSIRSITHFELYQMHAQSGDFENYTWEMYFENHVFQSINIITLYIEQFDFELTLKGIKQELLQYMKNEIGENLLFIVSVIPKYRQYAQNLIDLLYFNSNADKGLLGGIPKEKAKSFILKLAENNIIEENDCARLLQVFQGEIPMPNKIKMNISNSGFSTLYRLINSVRKNDPYFLEQYRNKGLLSNYIEISSGTALTEIDPSGKATGTVLQKLESIVHQLKN